MNAVWVNQKIPAIRIRVWPVLTFAWIPWLKQWGICLVHNETISSATQPTEGAYRELSV